MITEFITGHTSGRALTMRAILTSSNMREHPEWSAFAREITGEEMESCTSASICWWFEQWLSWPVGHRHRFREGPIEDSGLLELYEGSAPCGS